LYTYLSKSVFIGYRNEQKTILKFAEKNTIHPFLQKTVGIFKKNWQIINVILLSSTNSSPKHPTIQHDNGNVLSDYAAGNKLNSYFANVGTDLSAKLKDSTVDFQKSSGPAFSAAFQPTD